MPTQFLEQTLATTTLACHVSIIRGIGAKSVFFAAIYCTHVYWVTHDSGISTFFYFY